MVLSARDGIALTGPVQNAARRRTIHNIAKLPIACVESMLAPKRGRYSGEAAFAFFLSPVRKDRQSPQTAPTRKRSRVFGTTAAIGVADADRLAPDIRS